MSAQFPTFADLDSATLDLPTQTISLATQLSTQLSSLPKPHITPYPRKIRAARSTAPQRCGDLFRAGSPPQRELGSALDPLCSSMTKSARGAERSFTPARPQCRKARSASAPRGFRLLIGNRFPALRGVGPEFEARSGSFHGRLLVDRGLRVNARHFVMRGAPRITKWRVRQAGGAKKRAARAHPAVARVLTFPRTPVRGRSRERDRRARAR